MQHLPFPFQLLGRIFRQLKKYLLMYENNLHKYCSIQHWDQALIESAPDAVNLGKDVIS